jgi:hypothetical protein
MGSTETTTPVVRLLSIDLRTLEQSAVGIDFGLENDVTFDSVGFLLWDKLIVDYQNMPENQSGGFV